MYHCGVVKKFDVIVDCRTHGEYTQGHIGGAVFMPMERFAHDYEQLSKDQTIGVYCRSGHRSGAVVNFLKQHGYDATNLGGINQFIGCLE